MDERLRGLGSREVQAILGRLGFSPTRTAGSHQQYVGVVEGQRRRVTVILGQRAFARRTLLSMMRQSGRSQEDWAAAFQ